MYTSAINKNSYDTRCACNDHLAIPTCKTLKYSKREFVFCFLNNTILKLLPNSLLKQNVKETLHP